MSQPRFSDLRDLGELAQALGVSAERISEYAAAADQASYFKVLQIPKRGHKRRGQFRVVHSGGPLWLLQLHRMVALLIAANTELPDCVQGFVRKRSILTNARRHLGKKLVLHADLVGFFDAITAEQVRLSFASLGSPPAMAELLGRACTIDGALRQGTRCSPALANLVCRQLDVDMTTLGVAEGATYSRYADDMTFSGDRVPASADIEAIVKRHGFALRDGRCHLQQRGRGQYVTGLTVSTAEAPRLPRRLKRRMRLVLHYIARFGVDNHFARANSQRIFKDQRALEGALRYFHSIEPALTKKLRVLFHAGIDKSTPERERLRDLEMAPDDGNDRDPEQH